eukprot:8280259-Lingulodinium_polyedra.AAC.1
MFRNRRATASASSLRLPRLTASASMEFGHGHWRGRHMDTGADGTRTPVQTVLLPGKIDNKQ